MDLFAGLKSYFKTDTTNIDNIVFRLHYKATAIILVAFSILITGRQYIGDPIACFSGGDIPTKVLETFCWIHATFSLPDAWEKKVGEEILYPGVAKYTPGEKRVYHAYYQWVCFVLFLQAILFYIPRYFWKAMEGGRIKNLILRLNCPILPDETKNANRKRQIDYMVSNLHNHNFYFMSYVLAEVMNFVNVVGQIFLMDAFLGGEFLSYGSRVSQFTDWGWSVRYDPMVKVFPRLTKCTFHKYGSSGYVQRHDALCILPINIINEKIYVFLWFWFVILSALSGVVLLYRTVIVLVPRSRLVVMRFRSRLANQDYLETVINKCKLGDWFILDLLSKNLDPLNFRDIVNDFAQRLDGKALDDA